MKIIKGRLKLSVAAIIALIAMQACSYKTVITADTVLINGQVYTGTSEAAKSLDVAICGDEICGLYQSGEYQYNAKTIINAQGKIVSSGFIDPHTHTLEELSSKEHNHNLNYLTQGVTTVINGNDGDGPIDVKSTVNQLAENGIGTNTAFLVGHNTLRKQVIGLAQRHATKEELQKMSVILEAAMKNGALGISTGLYYVPGSYASTEEVIALAKIAAKYQGIYDTHLRDESSFTVGFLSALDEAISIARQANIHLHLAHIKALGVDVWGQSEHAIDKIVNAQNDGVSISADQYPWLASGTFLRNAVMPKWVMADSTQAFHQRLNDPLLASQLRNEINENIRRRGGANALVVTVFKDLALVGMTLEQIAKQRETDPISTAIALVQEGAVRVASYNMQAQDVEAFMKQSWVVTSSDGTNGHPRKFASFPQKYQEYVVSRSVITLTEFINRSTAVTANILGLNKRGQLKKGYFADIIIFDAEKYSAKADYTSWNKYSVGVEHVWVNGQHVINHGHFANRLAGQVILKTH